MGSRRWHQGKLKTAFKKRPGFDLALFPAASSPACAEIVLSICQAAIVVRSIREEKNCVAVDGQLFLRHDSAVLSCFRKGLSVTDGQQF